jgi:hypothetical protein
MVSLEEFGKMKIITLNKSRISKNKFFKSERIFLFLVLILCLNFNLAAEIRYVSNTGNPTPPYTSWETASDNIQLCIDISQSGDTIFVAEGVYTGKIILIPGISLIGAGFESIIDTRPLTYEGFFAMEFADDCLVSDFFFLVSYIWFDDHWVGNGIRCTGGTGIIRNVKIEKAYIGIQSRGESSVLIKDNIIHNITTGIQLVSSNSTVQNNVITEMKYGVFTEAATSYSTPYIEQNQIIGATTAGINVHNSFSRPTIRNNFIFIDSNTADGIFGGGLDTIKIFNNLIIANKAHRGITNNNFPSYVYNNFLIGKFNYRGIFAASQNYVINNAIINSPVGIVSPITAGAVIKYNNSWNNEINYPPFLTDTTNISVNPMVVNDDSTHGMLDFRLQMFSPLIDAGDPALLDPDGTRSDIGLYGGPFGESYIYQDLPPRIPVNFSILFDSVNINLSWNVNTEADFFTYRVYRDTIPDFQINPLNMISEQNDTSFAQIMPAGTDRLYFKLTSVDNQMNESLPTEELAVILSSGEELPVVITDYVLYQNYPNPFNPSTKISYKLKDRGYVKLYIYDIKGEIVAELVNKFQEKGYHEISFDTSTGSSDISSGMYIYHLNVKNENNIPVFSKSGKMIFMK